MLRKRPGLRLHHRGHTVVERNAKCREVANALDDIVLRTVSVVGEDVIQQLELASRFYALSLAE